MKMLWVCHLKMPEIPHFSDLGARKIKRMTASDFHLFQATPLQGRSPHLCHTHKGPRRSELWEERSRQAPCWAHLWDSAEANLHEVAHSSSLGGQGWPNTIPWVMLL